MKSQSLPFTFRFVIYLALIICTVYGLFVVCSGVLKRAVLNRNGIEVLSREYIIDQWGPSSHRQGGISNQILIAATAQPKNSLVAIRVMEKELTAYDCNVICGIQSLVLLELYGCTIPDGYTARMINGNPSLQVIVLDFSDCDLQPISLFLKHRELKRIHAFKAIIPEDDILSVVNHGVAVIRNHYFSM